MSGTITEVTTFVLFDLEATGLDDKPRITELSLVAVHRSSLYEPVYHHAVPRVLNKLTVCVDPQKPISIQACNITGLYNDALSLHSPFNESTADLIESFLSLLPQPVCLLAHNGHKFDYPLLSAELLRVGRQLPPGILCADSLDCLRQVLSDQTVKEFINRSPSPPKPPTPFSPVPEPTRVMRPVPKKGRLVKGISRKLFGPSDVTPEMHSFKFTGFSNAPKKKPLEVEVPKEERVTAVKKKLDFGSPGPIKMTVDDVDVEDVLDHLSGGFRVTPNNSLQASNGESPIRLIPDSQETVDFMKESQEMEVVTASQATLPFSPSRKYHEAVEEIDSLWHEDEELSDDLLLNAVEELEQPSPVKSPKCERQDKPVASTSNSTNNGISIPHALSAEPIAQPITPNGPSTSSKGVSPKNTTPKGGHRLFLDSFPTPSPSPHKSPQEEDADLWPLVVTPSASPVRPPAKSPNNVGFSLSLPSVHLHVVGHEPRNSHCAEDDCMALLRVIHRLSKWVVPWLDNHTTEFSTVTPLYTSYKRPKKV